MRIDKRLLPTILSLSLASGVAFAQQSGSAPSATDTKFMKDAAAANMAEVEVGRLASEKASSTEVRDFGRMLVDDHSKAMDELKSLASKKNVALPTEPTAEQKAEKARLSKLSGRAFDDAFAKAMVGDHEKAVKLFRDEHTSGTDPDAKSWAGNTLPTLEKHRDEAKKLAGNKSASHHASGHHARASKKAAPPQQ
jgi:putative membrane protein